MSTPKVHLSHSSHHSKHQIIYNPCVFNDWTMYTAMCLFISMLSYKTNSCANSEILYRAFLNGFAAQVSNTARRLHTRDQKCHQPTEGKEKKKKKNSLCYAKLPQIPESGSSSIGSIVIMHWLITEYQEQENPDYSFHQSTGFPWPLLRMISGAK